MSSPESTTSSITNVTIFSALSFYSPLILMVSILLFSLFSSAAHKGVFYIFCLFVATALRFLIVLGAKTTMKQGNAESGSNTGTDFWEILKETGGTTAEICKTGVFFPTTNYTFSTFILVLTLTYFVAPMIIISKKNKVNSINYMVLIFFLSYICYDIGIKYTYQCIDFSSQLSADLFGGILIGSLIVITLMSTGNMKLLFINELTSNKEVCTRPSKQQFKCSLYKNGEIVGSSISK